MSLASPLVPSRPESRIYDHTAIQTAHPTISCHHHAQCARQSRIQRGMPYTSKMQPKALLPVQSVPPCAKQFGAMAVAIAHARIAGLVQELGD